MGHHHNHDHHIDHHHGHDHSQGESSIGTAFILNLVFTIIEIIGGFYTNSLAILSDAIHDLGDSMALGLAWYFQKISKRPGDQQFTYGYKRWSVVGAIINSVVLIIGSFFILQAAILRLLDPQEPQTSGMMILAVLGIVFNGLAYSKTHGGHSHNEKLVSLHLLEDLLGWVAVLIGSIVMHYTGWYIIDPILSICISLFILYNVFKYIKSTLNIILQGTPDDIDIQLIEQEMKKIRGVQDVHDIHVWTLDGQHHILTAHIVVDKDMDMLRANQLKAQVHEAVRTLGISHCTLEIERVGEDCVLDKDIKKSRFN